MIEVKRSPARVTWHILCNGLLVECCDTRAAANVVAEGLANKFGLEFKK